MKRSEAAPLSCSGWSMNGSPEVAYAPTAITIFGAGVAS